MTPRLPTDDQDEQEQQQPETDDRDRLEAEQLDLPAAELSRLADRIETDYRAALADHNRRMTRWAEYWRRWHGTPDIPLAGDEDKSNLPVPYLRWMVLSKLATEMDQLFGDDAQIVAHPVGPSDYRKDKKIGLYMTWRVFNSMKLATRFYLFVLRKIIFGRSVAYAPYVRKTYTVRGKEVVDYEGPDFQPLPADDVVTPGEEVESIQKFSWVIRKYRATPGELLQGEEEGRYFGIEDDFQNIVQMAQNAQRREPEGEEIKTEGDEASGIQMTRPQSAGESLLVLEWYGRWRPLKKGREDAAETDFAAREMEQAEYVVRYLWDMHKVIGVQDLAELYPELPERRPFVEASLQKDGTYFPPGFGKMLIDLEDDLRQNHNLGTDAGELTVQPMIFYRPASGFDKETFEIGPGKCVPVDNPSTDVKVIEIGADLAFTAARNESLLSFGERLTGQSDLTMGRQGDRPNEPKTVGGTMAIMNAGGVRIALDTLVLREDMSVVLTHFWLLERMFSPASTFFRVTEDDADGLFPVNDGGGTLEKNDRDGRYDFRLQFATSMWSREAEKARTIQRYGIDIQNPLIIQNPMALWRVTCDVHEALGDPNFADTVPQPPEPDLPVNPKEEYNRLLQGEDIHVHPLDNDELHLVRHMKDIQAEQAKPEGERDADVLPKLVRHYTEQIDQLTHKKAVQAITEAALQQLQATLPPQVVQMLMQNATLGQPPAAGQPGGGGAPAAAPVPTGGQQ